MSRERARIGIAIIFILVMSTLFVIIHSDPQKKNDDDNLGPSSSLRPPQTDNITSSRNPTNDSMASNITKDHTPLLLWSDEFAGSELSQDDWSYEYDTIESVPLFQEEDKEDIHEKIEMEFHDSHAASVKDGILTINTRQAINASVPFLSGRIKTQDKLLFQYGTIEARIRFDSGCQDADVCVNVEYLSPSFWTRGSGWPSYGQPTRGQVDIFSASIQTPTGARRSGSKDEAVVRTRADEEGDTKVSSELTRSRTGHHWMAHSGATWITTIANSDDARHIEKSLHSDYPPDNPWKDQDFHVYKFDWTPNRMATFIDEELVWDMDITDGSCGDCQAFHRPHYLLLGVSVMESPSWSSPSSSMVALDVDYIRLLDNGFAIVSHPET